MCFRCCIWKRIWAIRWNHLRCCGWYMALRLAISLSVVLSLFFPCSHSLSRWSYLPVFHWQRTFGKVFIFIFHVCISVQQVSFVIVVLVWLTFCLSASCGSYVIYGKQLSYRFILTAKKAFILMSLYLRFLGIARAIVPNNIVFCEIVLYHSCNTSNFPCLQTFMSVLCGSDCVFFVWNWSFFDRKKNQRV